MPALRELPLDPELGGAPTRVYLVLLHELDGVEFRPVKAWALAQILGMKPHTVGRALKMLVRKGYLQRGAWLAREHSARTYRVIYARQCGALAPERQ